MNKIVQTYKMTDANMVFNPNGTPFQYVLGEKYTMSGDISICSKGFHSCQTPMQCLDYYSNDGKNRLFLCEVEINDNTSYENGDNETSFKKIATDNITFIREITNLSQVFNSGSMNSGSMNSGSMNSGSMNSGNWNSGDLNTTRPPWRCFNQFQTTVKTDHYFPSWMYFDLVVWKGEGSMTEEEKKQHPYYSTVGGCLIIKDFKDAAQESYNNATKSEQDAIEALPSYNADILFEIFGIDRRK